MKVCGLVMQSLLLEGKDSVLIVCVVCVRRTYRPCLHTYINQGAQQLMGAHEEGILYHRE